MIGNIDNCQKIERIFGTRYDNLKNVFLDKKKPYNTRFKAAKLFSIMVFRYHRFTALVKNLKMWGRCIVNPSVPYADGVYNISGILNKINTNELAVDPDELIYAADDRIMPQNKEVL